MADKKNIQVNGWFPPALFLVFLTLKLTGVIAWSWWWVTAPLWGPPAFFFSIAGVCFVIAFILNIDLKKKR